jgi:hypothetical protein
VSVPLPANRMQEEGQKRISNRPHPKTRQKRWKAFSNKTSSHFTRGA